jgi:hypothetical protein
MKKFNSIFNLILEELNDDQKEMVDMYTARRKKTLSFGPMFKDERTYFDVSKTTLDVLKTPKEILDIVDDAGYYINDYREGYAYKKGDKLKNKPVKILKILSKELNNKTAGQNEFNRLKKLFDERLSTSRKTAIDCLICITHNPYDVAGMSTDRNWTSCMELEAGAYYETALKQVQYGGMCAYLIKADDKNIEEPIARIAIKRLVGINDSKAFIFVSEDNIYGDSQFAKELNFDTQVKQILEQSNEKTFKTEFMFKRRDGNSYSDLNIEEVILPTVSKETMDKFKQRVEKNKKLRENLSKLDWRSIFKLNKFPEEFLTNFAEYIDWDDVSYYLDKDAIMEITNKDLPIFKNLVWFPIFMFHRLPEEFIKKNLDKILESTANQKTTVRTSY